MLEIFRPVRLCEFAYIWLDSEPLPYLRAFGDEGRGESFVYQFIDRFGLENRQRKQAACREGVGFDLLAVAFADAVKADCGAGFGGVEELVGEFMKKDLETPLPFEVSIDPNNLAIHHAKIKPIDGHRHDLHLNAKPVGKRESIIFAEHAIVPIDIEFCDLCQEKTHSA